jgi:MFS transporter, ACS family, glucarate transporter
MSEGGGGIGEAPAEDGAPTRVRYRVMAFLCALAFLTYYDRVCIMRAQMDIQRDLGLMDWQLGYVIGAFYLAYGLFEIPGGWLCDRFGSRAALIRIVLGWSLFTALSGCATGFLSLLTFRFLFGMGEAGAFPTMAAIQSRWVPAQQRARFGGILWFCARWGGAFSPLLFGLLIRGVDAPAFRETLGAIPLLAQLKEASSWRFGFWTAGALGVLWCLAFYPWFRNTPAQTPAVNAAERALLAEGSVHASGSHATNRTVWRALFASRSLWALAGLYFFGSFGWSFFVSWLPRYLKDTHGVAFANSEIMSGLPLLMGGIACLVGGLLCDWLVRRSGRKRLARAVFPIVGCAVAACAMFAVRGVSSAWEATILICLASAAYDFGQSSNWASLVDIGGRHAGIAVGLVNMIGNFASFIQPRVGAYLFTNFGYGALMISYTLAFLIAGAMWFFIDPTRTFYEEKREESKVLPESIPSGSGIKLSR